MNQTRGIREQALEYRRSTGELVACWRRGREFYVTIDGEEVGRRRLMRIGKGQTALGVALELAREYHRRDVEGWA